MVCRDKIDAGLRKFCLFLVQNKTRRFKINTRKLGSQYTKIGAGGWEYFEGYNVARLEQIIRDTSSLINKISFSQLLVSFHLNKMVFQSLLSNLTS